MRRLGGQSDVRGGEDKGGGKRDKGWGSKLILKIKDKKFGNQLDSDTWREKREMSHRIFFYSFSQSLLVRIKTRKHSPKLGLFLDNRKLRLIKEDE